MLLAATVQTILLAFVAVTTASGSSAIITPRRDRLAVIEIVSMRVCVVDVVVIVVSSVVFVITFVIVRCVCGLLVAVAFIQVAVVVEQLVLARTSTSGRVHLICTNPDHVFVLFYQMTFCCRLIVFCYYNFSLNQQC